MDDSHHLLSIPSPDLVRAVLSDEQPEELPVRGGFVVTVFSRASTRTRISAAAAASSLGLGHLEIPWDSFYGNPQVHGFAPHNAAAEMRSMAELGARAVIVRTDDHAGLVELARRSPVPVISGATSKWHPLQGLTDLRVISRSWPGARPVRISFVGNGQSPVASSLVATLAHGRFRVTVVTPPGYEPRPEVLATAGPGSYAHTCDLAEGLGGSDVIYTDEWFYSRPSAEQLETFSPYVLTGSVVERLAPGARIMHCLPHAQEIDPVLLDGGSTLVWEQVRERAPTLIRTLNHLMTLPPATTRS